MHFIWLVNSSAEPKKWEPPSSPVEDADDNFILIEVVWTIYLGPTQPNVLAEEKSFDVSTKKTIDGTLET